LNVAAPPSIALSFLPRAIAHFLKDHGEIKISLGVYDSRSIVDMVIGQRCDVGIVNLAISIAAELDKTVLLVDADVSRPSVLSRLGLAPARGLLDVLADPSVQLSDVLLRTNIDGLTILPAGAPRGQATELLASEGMTRLVDELAARYADRVLIFDAPPLLPSTESRVLASHMGQVVVVVEAERTAQKSVMQAMATLESCPVVMPLLNKASRSEVGFYYGYYGPVEG